MAQFIQSANFNALFKLSPLINETFRQQTRKESLKLLCIHGQMNTLSGRNDAKSVLISLNLGLIQVLLTNWRALPARYLRCLKGVKTTCPRPYHCPVLVWPNVS